MQLKAIHTSQFQLVNLGNTTRKKTLVCKKVGGQLKFKLFKIRCFSKILY